MFFWFGNDDSDCDIGFFSALILFILAIGLCLGFISVLNETKEKQEEEDKYRRTNGTAIVCTVENIVDVEDGSSTNHFVQLRDADGNLAQYDVSSDVYAAISNYKGKEITVKAYNGKADWNGETLYGYKLVEAGTSQLTDRVATMQLSTEQSANSLR